MDRYSKVALTVIVIALSVIAVRMSSPSAFATGLDCGARFDPCYVDASATNGMQVYVTNLR